MLTGTYVRTEYIQYNTYVHMYVVCTCTDTEYVHSLYAMYVDKCTDLKVISPSPPLYKMCK